MRTLIAALVLAAVPRLALAAEVDAPSKVTKVTVFQGRARVTRTARVSLPAGDVSVKIAGLSTRLEGDSLRVTGKGSASARIEGVNVETVTGAEGISADYKAAEARLEALREKNQALADRISAARARLAFVDAFRTSYAKRAAADLPVRKVDPAGLAKLADFVATEHEKGAATIRQAKAAQRGLALQIQAAEVRQSQLQAKRGFVSRTVVVALHVDHPGRFVLEIAYLVSGATWTPVWDARLDPARDEVTLSLYGKVTQTTGVDWRGVDLAVSTAAPARGLTVPELSSRYLTPAPVILNVKTAYGEAARAEAAAAPPPPMAHARAPEKALERERMATIQIVRARITKGELSATFAAPRATTVEGAGKAERAFLASWQMKAKVDRRAAPRRDPTAYLVATAKNATGVPLLPGRASIFLGREMVGHTWLSAVAPGDEMKIPFGADERVKVERRVLERKHAETGIFSKDEVMRYHVRTTVKNLWDHPVTVTLLDQVPVSRDQSITVKVLDGSTKPTSTDKDHPGVRRHELTLPAHGKATVELRYEVHWPKGHPITGLD